MVEQTVYLPKYRLHLLSDPQWLRRGAGDLLLDRLMSDLVEAKATTVSCRQYNQFDKDDKTTKLVARRMIQMVFDIIKEASTGRARSVVTPVIAAAGAGFSSCCGPVVSRP